MELEIGMYVRTKTGLIAKYIDINHGYNWHVFDGRIQWYYEYYRDEIDFDSWEEFIKEKVVKVSHNIIEVIEKKDIILATDGGIYEVARIDKDYVFTTTKTKEGLTKTLVDYQIDRILTKEQFENMSYKRGN